MAITLNDGAIVSSGGQSSLLSTMFAVTAAMSDPTYLVLTAIDRDEYAAGATGATGSFTGAGNTATFAGADGDGRETGLVFTYQSSTGRYYNATYGYFDQLRYTPSSSLNDVTNISVFTTSSLSLANSYATDAYAMMQVDPGGYVGSATVATQPAFTGPVPTQATPLSLAAVALTFVGDAWNMDGCWVLASAIAAEAGASLPVQSTAIGLAGQANGEWVVAYNGPTGQSGNWQSLVTTGDVVVFGTPGGGGHITTCVSGSGATALLVDNITYENQNGQITNAANDGSANDVLVAAPHLASQEWSGVAASSVVIYELDTPIVTDKAASDNAVAASPQSLSSLFSANDPANRAISSYQIYDTALFGSFLINNVAQAAHSAATALTVSSLSTTAYDASASGADTIEIRAFNGAYWGDWQTLSVAATGASTTPTPAPSASAPVLNKQTAAQTWLQGQTVSLALPANTFTDPQSEALTYSATLSGGQALPNWLTFNAATRTFAGHVPAGLESLTISVTARDTSGLSSSEQFSATVPAAAPTVATATPNQNWVAGRTVSLALPAQTFVDPQGETLTYTATQSNGQALPSWLTFNAATDSFSGSAPITQQTLGLKVTATDASGLSVSESFSAFITPAGPALANQTGNLSEIDGHAFSYALPATTFADAASQHLTYLAYQVGGPNVTSWLHFNPATQTLSGTPPAYGTGTARIEIIATDANHMSASETFNLSYAAMR